MSYPKRVDHFRAWSKLMMEQATVPDRPSYKKNARAGKGGKKTRRGRRKRFLRRKRQQQD